uniref:Uncharacterized protein n=1 Tax=Mantoniella tinhauana virus 1 TaxID=3111543 RepID=A0AB38ZM79_9VIRU
MKITTIVVARSKSCSVKTLHSILRMNVICLQKGLPNNIVFVNDDPYEKTEMIQNHMKTADRIIFVDFGVCLDDDTIKQCLEPHEGVGCLVFPGVKEGVDWNLFKEGVEKGSKEPIQQMGLHFDTEVSNKISENIYNVTNTNARAWMMNTKNVIKAQNKHKDKKLSNKLFDKLKHQGVRIYAFTASKLTITYSHECVSSIVNASGVKVN